MKKNLFNATASLLFIHILINAPAVNAQQAALTAWAPTHQQMVAVYEKASKLDTSLRQIPLVNNIIPNWQANKTSFWYKLPRGNYQYEFYLADVTGHNKRLLFDHKKMAAALATILKQQPDPLKLPISNMVIDAGRQQVKIKSGDVWLQVDLNTYSCTSSTAPTDSSYNAMAPLERRRSRYGVRTDSLAPNGQWTTSIKDGNLFVKNNTGGPDIQLTTDGNAAAPYGRASWSPDSKHLVAWHINPKPAAVVYNLLTSVAGTTRAQLTSHEYMQPGDDMTSYEMFVFDPEHGTKLKVDAEKIDFFGAPELHWRKTDNRYLTYEKVDRGHQRFRVIETDVQTGKTKNIIDEKTNTFIYEQRLYTHYLAETNELVWITEKDGWRHIYLVNTTTGKEQLLTKGNWVVRTIDSVDDKKREIWFTASGMNAAEDPYFIHYYRVGFDGTHLVSLTPEPGNHLVSFSPDKKYYVDAYSQVNVPAVINIRASTDAQKIMELEKADAAAFLATGVKLPEVFVAKGRDGTTDIWGIVCMPSHMEPGKTYPIIENIYAGPQDAFVPKSFLPYGEMQSMAELGFIVVQSDGMGTANRSKAFHDVCWKNLADAGLPDRILWIKAMATKYPQADTTRVGIYGTSAGGQNSTGAMLFHPDFYKAAVSACGCHDNRIDKQWWNEQWMGYPVGPHYDAQSNITNAAKLKGNLLLIVGEADTNVPPESTYRLADALIKANKDFDFLTIPGANHTDGGPYGRRKKRDFFVRHLLYAEPPVRNDIAAAGN